MVIIILRLLLLQNHIKNVIFFNIYKKKASIPKYSITFLAILNQNNLIYKKKEKLIKKQQTYQQQQ